jgi:hypothetical protein
MATGYRGAAIPRAGAPDDPRAAPPDHGYQRGVVTPELVAETVRWYAERWEEFARPESLFGWDWWTLDLPAYPRVAVRAAPPIGDVETR